MLKLCCFEKNVMLQEIYFPYRQDESTHFWVWLYKYATHPPIIFHDATNNYFLCQHRMHICRICMHTKATAHLHRYIMRKLQEATVIWKLPHPYSPSTASFVHWLKSEPYHFHHHGIFQRQQTCIRTQVYWMECLYLQCNHIPWQRVYFDPQKMVLGSCMDTWPYKDH